MNAKISRVTLLVYVILFIASFFLMCIPGGRVLWYAIMAIFALPSVIFGPQAFRIIGVAALVIALGSMILDYDNGKEFHARQRRKAVLIENEKGTADVKSNNACNISDSIGEGQ